MSFFALTSAAQRGTDDAYVRMHEKAGSSRVGGCVCVQEYKAHWDYFFHKEGISNGGNRYATVLMYLATTEEVRMA